MKRNTNAELLSVISVGSVIPFTQNSRTELSKVGFPVRDVGVG